MADKLIYLLPACCLILLAWSAITVIMLSGDNWRYDDER